MPRRLSLLERFAIHDGVTGGLLPCGCACGRYVTYAGAVLTVIDEASSCAEGHEPGMVIHETPAGQPPPPLPFEPADKGRN